MDDDDDPGVSRDPFFAELQRLAGDPNHNTQVSGDGIILDASQVSLAVVILESGMVAIRGRLKDAGPFVVVEQLRQVADDLEARARMFGPN